jgi:YggT family protein
VHYVYLILEIYLYVLIVRIILSWFPISPGTAMDKVVRVFAAVTDPVLKPLRKVLPPVRVGGMGLDLSPIIVLVVLEIILQLIG